MGTDIAISVIIPVYNAEESIDKCLDSLLKQSLKNFEIILLNDGSTDNTLSVLKEYELKYDFVNLIDKENEGVANTRNLGIKLAKGKYIMFMDNDDFIDIDYLEVFYNTIESEKLDIVIGGYRRVSDKKTLFTVSLVDTDWSKYRVISPWAKIYKRKFLINNDIKFLDYIIGEDVYFNLIAYGKTNRIKSISYVGYNWYDNQESISNTAHKGFKKEADIIRLFELVAEKVDLNNELMKFYIKRFYIYYLLYSGRTASPEAFIEEYRRIKAWIEVENYNSTLSAFSKKVAGESLGTRTSIVIFEQIEKCRLLGLFSKLYCRGKS